MKVTKLHIDEYKVFKDFDIDFTDREGNAQNLIVLAGINGTGKTTLLEFIFQNIGSRGYGVPISRLDEVGVTESYIELVKADLKYFEPSRSFKLNDNALRFYYNTHVPIINIEDYTQGVLLLGVIHFKKSRERGLSNYGSALGSQYLGVSDSYFDSDELIIGNYIRKCILEENLRAFEAYEKLQKFLNQILLDFNLDIEFSKLDYQEKPFFKNKLIDNLLIDDLSSGERQIISYVLNLFVAGIKDSIILIDEPEFSLHPSWQNKIVGVLQKYADEYNCQVILATHSPHIIGSVHPEQLRLLYKDENGAIKVRQNVHESYGLPIDQVLFEIMGAELRTPKVESDLNILREMIKQNQYDSEAFKTKFKEMEGALGYSDNDLILMRFEIAKRKKESEANTKK